MHTHTHVISEPTLIGSSPALERLRSSAARVAAGNAKVLITGESGVGKDLIARFIHARSPRAERPFVALNCAGVAETLLESELFGHVKGSFTGAHRDKVGLFQLGNRGTVFLDEVGEMSLRMQAMLLRFLESGEVKPVGADLASGKVDVRVIAATNRNLPDLVSKGQFREDLMYRIMVVHLEVPPLRNRREDIRALVAHIIEKTGVALTLSEEAMRGARALQLARERPRAPERHRTARVAGGALCRRRRRSSTRPHAVGRWRCESLHANDASRCPTFSTKDSSPAPIRSGSTSTRCSSIETSRAPI